jgi:hypothetical protein
MMDDAEEITGLVDWIKEVPDKFKGTRYVFAVLDQKEPFCGDGKCPVSEGDRITVFYKTKKGWNVVQHVSFEDGTEGTTND